MKCNRGLWAGPDCGKKEGGTKGEGRGVKHRKEDEGLDSD